jgi:hypothetical protein
MLYSLLLLYLNLCLHKAFENNFDNIIQGISLSSFRDSRTSALELSLWKLGVERLSKDDVQKMQWEAFEAKIGN